MTATRLTAAELVQIDAAAVNAMLQIRLGTADSETHQTLNAIINVCWYATEMVERHKHLRPVVDAANEAAANGYQDIAALDMCCEVYKAICRATPRKMLKRAINTAVAQNSIEEPT